MTQPLLKYWPITATCIVWLAGAVWWAATIQSDVAVVKRDVAEIKAYISAPHAIVQK